MRKTFYLFLLCLSFSAVSVCYADTSAEFDAKFAAGQFDPSSDGALDQVKKLYTDRFADLQTKGFGGFGDLMALLPSADNSGDPPILNYGTTQYFGDVVLNLGSIPIEFWYGISLLINAMCAWTAFTIVVRP